MIHADCAVSNRNRTHGARAPRVRWAVPAAHQRIGTGMCRSPRGVGYYIDGDDNEMAETAQDHKNVPELMESENARKPIRPLGDIHGRSNCEEDSTTDKPRQRGCGHGAQYDGSPLPAWRGAS